jgi:hypothetical protein
VETLAATPELEKLLRERRYEEALKVLYAARASAPKDQAISRSIRLLRERIAVDYAARLVNLDRVPARGERISGSLLSSEERQVLSLVDGISSYGDIVAASPMGRLNTLRMLCSFLDTGLVTASSPSVSPPNARSGSHLRARPVVPPEQVPPTVPSSVSSAAVSGAAGAAVAGSLVGSHGPSSSSRQSSPPRVATPTAQSLRAEPPPSFVGHPARRSQPPPSALGELPPSSRPSRPPSFSNSHPDDGFDALFAQATEAYLLRDFQRAVDLFTQCSLLRPADRRVLHNLKALQRRLSSP